MRLHSTDLSGQKLHLLQLLWERMELLVYLNTYTTGLRKHTSGVDEGSGGEGGRRVELMMATTTAVMIHLISVCTVDQTLRGQTS